MKKRYFSPLVLSLLLLFSFAVPTHADEAAPVRLWMSGQYLNSDVDPIIQNDRTLVPLRIISENLGYEVEWVAETLTVVLKKPDQTTLTLRINEPYIQEENKQAQKLDVAPILYNNRTMVPIRVVAENLGLQVDWDNNNRTVVIGDGYIIPVSANTFQEAYVVRAVSGDTVPLPASDQAQGKIIGNKNSGIYHVPGGASYDKVSSKNAVYFDTEAQAQAAGYRRAKR
ncbi:stalk domain-containing protein [Peptoniphilus equinus]|uniref:Stalk domain-containing protein n=1 Tax=Peptoniphilus equinus TaxID=3016343 RepID=A0ABY7QUT7_9FIRM|nr:stalk domain-containing protein [Peptoniphilus equinus]WBW50554.1 stalk domain-containing protein [Peptoniphilus equinus]